MTPIGRIAAATLAACFCAGADPDDVPEKPKAALPRTAPTLGMSPAVACSRVDGFERYAPLPGASLTSEDKLKVYFRPLTYKIEPYKEKYRARFTQDGRVRRKGEKAVLSKEDKLLEFEATFDQPDYQIFLTNTVGLKNLPPGEYEFEIILHDALVEGSSASQTLPFTVIPTPKVEPASKVEGPGGPEGPPGPAESAKEKSGKAKPKRSPKPRG